ncbi:Lreu_0056 family protein [Limosilactobacillus agrestis]|uniref:Lreu_0056 family protein n=1 Tax=Limosilactobacillus agrestis TaxID=2759748 RepID=UPI001E55E33B|nr:hypothetical protein [Limosilactobacillus agrestis]MCD7111942.1 hypothetical protein [Limosilactobacillus agrestis]MCD7119515.1 hypothetical protein [Limosilactobacillus agrestis]
MKKLLTISATLLAGLTLAACSSSSSSQSSNSSSESSTSNNAKQASSQQKKPLVSKKVSENDNSSSSKSTKAANVSDPKIIGLLAYQDVFGKGLDSENPMYFGPNTDDSDCDGQYILTTGSGSGIIYFSVDGDQVTIYKKDYSGGKSEAEAKYTSYTVSLQELINKFYLAPTQQQNAQYIAQHLKDANSSSDDSDQDSSSNDDDDNNSADQPSDDQSVDTNDDVDE